MAQAANTSNYSGKIVLILGLDRATLALAKLLHARGAQLRINDARAKDRLGEWEKELTQLQPAVEMEFGKYVPQYFEGNHQIIWSLSAGVDAKLLEELRTKGNSICSDVDFVLQENKVPVIALIGSEGKSTVGQFLRDMLKAAGKRSFRGGDQSHSFAEILERQAEFDYVILELSFGQLESMQQLRPLALGFLNLQAPFPERYSRSEDCLRLMQNALRNVTPQTIIIYNHRDNALRGLLVPVQANKYVFRKKDPLTVSPELAKVYRGAYLQQSREIIWQEDGNKSSISLAQASVFGPHNKENLMAALCLAKALGVPLAAIQSAVNEMMGAEHRLELIKKRGGVRFINDSRATTVECLRKSLDAFPLEAIILIAGGKDTQADFSSLADLVKQRVKTMILIGEAKEHINRYVGDHTETFLVGTFEEAILLSYQKSREGDIILFSPGCEGYDMLTGYEERGNYFKRYVTEL